MKKSFRIILFVFILLSFLFYNLPTNAKQQEIKGTVYSGDMTDNNGDIIGTWYWCLPGQAKNCSPVSDEPFCSIH